MNEKAFAKINLGLNVKKVDKDGYHPLESVMLPIEFHDNIFIEIQERKDDFVISDYPENTSFEYNLCHKAITEARKVWKFKETFYVFLHKNIFLSSGLGGGSSDAAAVVRSIIKLLKLNPTEEEIKKVCFNIGSDVYYCFYSKPAFVTSKGTELEFLDLKKDLSQYKLVLVKPHKGLSTTTVYKQFDTKKRNEFDISSVKEALLNDKELPKEILNSLEEPAAELMPELNDLKKEMLNFGFDFVFMTGGGNCYVGLTKERKISKKALNYFDNKDGYDVEISKFVK